MGQYDPDVTHPTMGKRLVAGYWSFQMLDDCFWLLR